MVDWVVRLHPFPHMTAKKHVIHEDDYKYMREKPNGDPDFNLKRNNEIIERTILKNDIVRADRQREFNKQLLERADAAASYLKAADRNPFLKPEDYFSKEELIHLQGRRILSKIGQEFMKRNAKTS